MKENVKSINAYLEETDWRSKETANSSRSLQGLNGYMANKAMKEWWLDTYPEHVKKANNDGYIYIHDLSSLSYYCAGWDLKYFLNNRFVAKNGVTSNPPQHLDVALDQLINWIFGLSGEFAGAMATASFDILLAGYIKKDNLSYEQVYQSLEGFIYKINFPGRIAMQLPFFNLTMDLKPPKHLKDQYVMLGGEILNFTYGELQKEINMINKAFAEVMTKGDAAGKIFSFPIPTYNITEDFDWDGIPQEVWEMNARLGCGYFANFLHGDMSADDAMSMCPLKGSTEILYLTDKNGEIKSSPIEEVYSNMQKRNDEYVYLIGADRNPVKSKINKFNISANYKITLMNGDVLYTTYNHLNKTRNSSEVKTCDLTEDDYLPYNTIVDGFEWVKIKSIEQINTSSTTSYCAEIVEENVEPIYMLSSGLMTHNCRLRLDLSKLRSRGGGLFASNPNTGAIGVVTLNLPMLMLEAKGDKKKFFEEIAKYCDIASESLEIKRSVVENLYGTTDENTMYPFSRRVLENCKKQNGEYGFNHFSVIGIVGSYEMCAEWDRFNGIEHNEPFQYTDEHRQLIVDTIQVILDKIPEIQERTGHLYNLEYTPCESASYTMGRKVQKAGGITSGTKDTPYLTNSTLPHSSFLGDLDSYLNDQNIFQPLATGGTVSHCFLGNRITAEKAKYMVKYLCENYKIPYFSLTPSFSICPTHGYISGQHFECPECGEKTLVYSRVVGFYKPVQQWNEGKVAEYNDRTFIDEEKI